MQYIKRTSLFLAIALIPSLGVALDPTTSGRIIDNFKEQEKDILFESLPFSESGANMILEHEYAMNGLDGLRARLSLVQGAYRQTILSYLTNIYSEGNMVLDTDGQVDIVK